jgi:hypothetical protein
MIRRLLNLLDKRATATVYTAPATSGNESNSSSTKDSESDTNTNSENNSPSGPIKLIFPPPALCTDNGVMVAWAGVEKIFLGISDEVEGQEVVARWPLGSPIEGGNAVFKKVIRKSKKEASQ